MQLQSQEKCITIVERACKKGSLVQGSNGSLTNPPPLLKVVRVNAPFNMSVDLFRIICQSGPSFLPKISGLGYAAIIFLDLIQKWEIQFKQDQIRRCHLLFYTALDLIEGPSGSGRHKETQKSFFLCGILSNLFIETIDGKEKHFSKRFMSLNPLQQ